MVTLSPGLLQLTGEKLSEREAFRERMAGQEDGNKLEKLQVKYRKPLDENNWGLDWVEESSLKSLFH